jgi:hypothetical protein
MSEDQRASFAHLMERYNRRKELRTKRILHIITCYVDWLTQRYRYLPLLFFR